MGAGGSTPPRKRNVKGVLPTAPIFGWGRGGIRKQERKQVQHLFSRIIGLKGVYERYA